jgi:Flp pilus assembly protein TadG
MKSAFNFFFRLAHCTSGNALVEMTFIIPVAVFLMVGVVDFGWMLATQATGSKAIHDAARYLANLPSTAICGANAWGISNAQNLAVYGNTAGTGSALIPGWTASNVQIDSTGCNASSPQQFNITVTATFPYSSIMTTTFIRSAFTLNAQHQEVSLAWFN